MWFFHQSPSGWCFLRGIFAALEVVASYQHLNLLAFSKHNCCGAKMLKNTLCLLVLLLILETYLGYLPLTLHTSQLFHQDQMNVIQNMCGSQQHGSITSSTWMQFRNTPYTCSIIYEHNISHVAKDTDYIICSYSPIVEKRYPILFTLNLCFTNE